VLHGVTVSRLVRATSGRWTLYNPEGAVDTTGNGAFDSVIIAVPAPQAAALVNSSGAQLDDVARATMVPCWALMISAEHALDIPDGLMQPDHPIIAWIGDESSKPGRKKPGCAAVVCATSDWSRANLELLPEAAAEILLEQTRALVSLVARPTYLQAHRLRFARVEQALGQTCL
jgi:renalase